MKIALVSPYDTAHPGGVFEHIAHLRSEFVRNGHDVTVLAPRGRKGGLEVRDGFYGIGRTVPIPANGSTVRRDVRRDPLHGRQGAPSPGAVRRDPPA